MGGFICPLCRKNFGSDQKKFKEHLANSILCNHIANNIIKIIEKGTETEEK